MINAEKRIEDMENEIIKEKWEGFVLGIGSGISIACIIFDIVILLLKIRG